MKKKFYIILTSLLILSVCALSSFAGTNHPDRVVDTYGVLDSAEIASLTDKLDSISEKHNVDVAVVIIDSVDSGSIQEHADDYYDNNGYGMGDDDSGILFLFAVEDSDGHISTCGDAINIISDNNVEQIFDSITAEIKSGEYMSAFSEFADMCEEYIVDYNSFHPVTTLLISLVIGFVIALIVTLIMRAQLKSIREKSGAADYMKKGSLNVTVSRDIFLYRQVTRTQKAESSSTHTSSSGKVHGGGSRHF